MVILAKFAKDKPAVLGGLIVAAVGLKMPAILIAGFIPMFLTAYAYRELNSRAPDCGASFT